MKKTQGFTLIEILIVTVIIILLTTAGALSYSTISKRARDARRSNDIQTIRSALEMYRQDFGYYPDSGGGSWTSVSSLTNILVPNYIQKLPADPRDAISPYQYVATNQSGSRYYGYCLALRFESQTGENSCVGVTLPSQYNYGVRHQ